MAKIIEIVEESDSQNPQTDEPPTSTFTPEQIIETLQSSPSASSLSAILEYLTSTTSFRIQLPGPESTRILSALTGRTIPDFGWLLNEPDSHTVSDTNPPHPPLHRLLVRIFRSLNGIKALLAAIEAQSARLRSGFTGASAVAERKSTIQLLLQFVKLLELVLEGDGVFFDIYSTLINSISQDGVVSVEQRRRILVRELVLLLTSNKLSTVVGEAEHLSAEFQSSLVDGQEYAHFLARNTVPFLVAAASEDKNSPEPNDDDDGDGETVRDQLRTTTSQIILRSWSLGYSELFMYELICGVLSTDTPEATFAELVSVIGTMSSLNQTKALLILTRALARNFPLDISDDPAESKRITKALAAVVSVLVAGIPNGRDGLTSIVTQPTSLVLASSFPTLRALILTLSSHDSIQTVLESSLSAFGDVLNIAHSPAAFQIFLVQKILISAAYIGRTEPMALFTLARSSYLADGLSNRLSSSSERARLLGMVVGMALSRMVDKEGRFLKFENEELESDECKMYFKLVEINDGPIGTLQEAIPVILQARHVRDGPSLRMKNSNVSGVAEVDNSHDVPAPPKDRVKSGTPPSMQIVDLDNEVEETDEMEPKAYDPLSSNTPLLNPPIYIRDLLSGLKDTENIDKHAIALESAADLIRRQASQPSSSGELTDNVEALVDVLAGLRDNAEKGADFESVRQDALVALIVTRPEQTAPYLIRLLFDGDFSMSQRLAIISSIGLASVELAGIKEILGPAKGTPGSGPTPKTKAGPETRRFTAATVTLEASLVHPIAAEAADRLSGPDNLKVETATSVSKTIYKSSAMARRHQTGSSPSETKKRQNFLARIVAQHLFFPLTARFWANYQAYGRSSAFTTPYILPLFLKTLALLLDAAGPTSPSFGQMVSELWDLLLAMRTISVTPSMAEGSGSDQDIGPISDSASLTALLFSLLVLIDAVGQVSVDKAAIFDLVPGLYPRLSDTLTWTGGLLEQADRAESEIPIGSLGSSSKTKPKPEIRTSLGPGLESDNGDTEAVPTGPMMPGGMDAERVKVLSASVWTKCRDLLVAKKGQMMGAGRLGLLD